MVTSPRASTAVQPIIQTLSQEMPVKHMSHTSNHASNLHNAQAKGAHVVMDNALSKWSWRATGAYAGAYSHKM